MSSQFAMFVTVIEYLTQYNEIFANLLINISRSLQSRFALLADIFCFSLNGIRIMNMLRNKLSK